MSIPAIIHTTFVTRPCSSQNHFPNSLFVLWLDHPGLFVIMFFFFFKLSIPHVGFLDKCHTRAFNDFIKNVLNLGCLILLYVKEF